MPSECFTERTRPLIERVMLVRHKERKFGKGLSPGMDQPPQVPHCSIHRVIGTDRYPADIVSVLIVRSPAFRRLRSPWVNRNYLFSGTTKWPGLKHLRRWHRTMKQSNEAPIAGVIPSDIFEASGTMACI